MQLRNASGAFWTLIVPAGIYIALSVLPIGTVLGNANYSNFILPGIIALTVMQGGIYTLAYWTIDLRHRGIIRQLSTTPMSSADFILGVVASRSLMMLVQAILLSLIGILFFHVHILGSIPLIILVVILGAFVFLPLGLLISVFANNYEAAAPISTGVGLPLTFLGSVFYPVAFLPGYLQTIGRFLPITYLADALRTLYSSHAAFVTISGDLAGLVAWFLILFGLSVTLFKIEE